MRFINLLFVYSILGLVGAFQRYLIGKLDLMGALVGGVIGVMLSMIQLRRDFTLAKKGIFVDTVSGHMRRIIIYIGVLIVVVFGVLIQVIQTKYFPAFDIKKELLSGIFPFGFTSGAIGILGIYFLERSYGKKFYIGSRKV